MFLTHATQALGSIYLVSSELATASVELWDFQGVAIAAVLIQLNCYTLTTDKSFSQVTRRSIARGKDTKVYEHKFIYPFSVRAEVWLVCNMQLTLFTADLVAQGLHVDSVAHHRPVRESDSSTYQVHISSITENTNSSMSTSSPTSRTSSRCTRLPIWDYYCHC